MNFEACLSLPHDPREAALIAANLEALGRALGDWPTEAWRKLAAGKTGARSDSGLFERLAARTAEAALDSTQRKYAERSAEAVAAVLRVLWPEAAANRQDNTTPAEVRLVSTG